MPAVPQKKPAKKKPPPPPKKSPAAPKKPSARRAKGSREHLGLSHEQIREAALRLIDEEGLDEFSTRKLGRALGCEAMAIYWYYPSKEALLDAVVESLVSRIVPASRAHDWLGALRGVAHGYRKLAHAHPKAFPLLATRRFATDGAYAFLEQLFALARAQGVPDRTTARFYRIVSSYCSGIALNEIATRRGGDDGEAAAAHLRFPHVAEVMAWLEPRHDDDVFDFGLEILLGALAEQARAASSTRH